MISCFHYMFKTNFSGHNKICGGHCARTPPVVTGLLQPLHVPGKFWVKKIRRSLFSALVPTLAQPSTYARGQKMPGASNKFGQRTWNKGVLWSFPPCGVNTKEHVLYVTNLSFCCSVIVSKLAVTIFNTLPFRTLWPTWPNFFRSFKEKFGKMTEKMNPVANDFHLCIVGGERQTGDGDVVGVTVDQVLDRWGAIRFDGEELLLLGAVCSADATTQVTSRVPLVGRRGTRNATPEQTRFRPEFARRRGVGNRRS